MATPPTEDAPKKKHHIFRKLIGLVIVAGATYIAEKIVKSKKKSS